MWDLSAALSLQRFQSSVYRRYNDFVVFHEMLLHKFPYRMVPALPPKRMLGGKAGLRRRGAEAWLGDGRHSLLPVGGPSAAQAGWR